MQSMKEKGSEKVS
ncbi:Protein of unknown function [Bacillus toyonensis]|nr:Protein of unknown function [Bacillus toyonensis]